MNELLLSGLLGGAAAAGVILLLQALPASSSNDGEYRRHLTAAEKQQLGTGSTLTKTHKAYNDVWHAVYHEGPLRVERQPDGKLRFTPYGKWQTLKRDGSVISSEEYTGYEQETVMRVFYPDGSLENVLYTVPAILDGDSVREDRVVYLRFGAPTDTIAVQHSYRKQGKRLKHETWSYDARGLRPVPAGWRFPVH